MVRLGESPMISLWLNNPTDKGVLMCAGVFSRTLQFSVEDANGHTIPPHKPSAREGAQAFRCVLAPNVQRRFIVPLADFVTLAAPGRYTIQATLEVGIPYHKEKIRSNTITIDVAK